MGKGDGRRTSGVMDPSSGIDKNSVRRQLERILASPEFHATEKVRHFLRFVVEEKLAGRSHRIKGYTVAVAVFDRGEDFDATHDPIVRIQAGMLRRALERYYLVGGVEDPIVIDIPKGRYIPRFTVQKPAKHSDPRFDQPTVADALEAVAPSIAVFPFENLTREDDKQILAVGLTEELVTELNRFQDLVVVPCRTAQKPVGAPEEPLELARACATRFLLTGAVRQDPETVKVSARLIDVADGRQLWADAFSVPADASHLIATHERIVGSVVGTIASEYGIIARRLSAESRKKPPTDLETYEAMLRYYGHQVAPTPGSAESCFAALGCAAEREPEYGPVWSALATLHCQMYTFGVEGCDNALATALEHAQKGVSLDPGSQLARLILAYANHLADDVGRFTEEAETALALNPNSPYVVGSIGYLRVFRGDTAGGLPLLERAIAVNPFHPAWFHAAYVIDHLLRQDGEAALAETQERLPFMSFWNDIMLAAILSGLHRFDEARRHVDQTIEQRPDIEGRVGEIMRRSLKIEALAESLLHDLERVGLSTGATDGCHP